MRIAKMRIPPEAIVSFLRGNKYVIEVIENPLPEDTEIIDIRKDFQYQNNIIWLVLRSEKFADIPEGGTISILDNIVFRRVVK